MIAFVLFAALVAFSDARPEPPSGYSYPVPSLSYGVPSSGSLGSLGGVGLGGHGSSFGGSFGGGSVSLGGSSLGGGHGLALGGASLGGFSSGASSAAFSAGSSSSSSFSSGFGSGSGGFAAGAGGFGAGAGGFGAGAGGFDGGLSSGGTVIQKHIYVHVPPAEPEEFRAPRPIQVAPPQKHYKIIFIKAPSPPTPSVPTIPLQAQNEEKTLVYVLVKKPDEQPEIQIPTAIPTQPSKPEVYFIRYKTQKESGGGFSAASVGGGAINGASLALGGGGVSLDAGAGLAGAHLSGAAISGASFSSGGSLDAGLAISGGSSHGGSISSSVGSSSAGLSTSYGPPGHVSGGPY